VVRFTNHGKTPAIIKRIRSYAMWTDAPPSRLTSSEREEKEVPEGLVIGPGGHFDLPVPSEIDGERYRGLFDVVWRLYIVGVIEYEDVMGTTHRTGFAWHTYPIQGEVRVSISPSPLNFFD
jgi:hypothetical protein